jgi:hypothetical protein
MKSSTAIVEENYISLQAKIFSLQRYTEHIPV